MGVYRNISKYDRNQYRVAIKTFNSLGVPEFKDIATFNNEITAACIYNIYAVEAFGLGAVVNDVDPDLMDTEEYNKHKRRFPKFEVLEQTVLEILESHTGRIKTHKDFND